MQKDALPQKDCLKVANDTAIFLSVNDVISGVILKLGPNKSKFINYEYEFGNKIISKVLLVKCFFIGHEFQVMDDCYQSKPKF